MLLGFWALTSLALIMNHFCVIVLQLLVVQLGDVAGDVFVDELRDFHVAGAGPERQRDDDPTTDEIVDLDEPSGCS